MEKQLSPQQEKYVIQFREELQGVYGVDDMFPPDASSEVREPRRPILPTLGSAAVEEFAPVYDLAAYRNRHLVNCGGLFVDVA